MDGTTSSLMNPAEHKFATWGKYNIELKVWSNNCSDLASNLITVVPPVPVAAFEIIPPNVCLGLSVSFKDSSVWATQWNWNFGDSSVIDTMENPVHKYKNPGIFHVQLTVTSDGGSNALSRDVQIYPLPKPLFTFQPQVVELPTIYAEAPARVTFYNTSQLGVKYLWNFGDSTISDETDPIHDYQSIGEKTVELYVWTEYNCEDSLIDNDTIDVISGGALIFPNVFVPSTSGPNGGKYDPTVKSADNSIFRPASHDIMEYDLEIYDRWGEKLFQSNDISIGWDGYYKGILCKGDVYVWMAKGKYINGQTFNLAGNVTLLK
jgi:PKD repeat protein